MIAMALASNPDLLIADEPTTALDVTTQASVIDLLIRLSEERDLAVHADHARPRASSPASRTTCSSCTPAPRSSTAPTDAGVRRAGPPVHAGAAGRGAASDRRPRHRARLDSRLAAARGRDPAAAAASRRAAAIGRGRDLCRTERPAFDLRDRARRVACHYEGEARERACARHVRAAGRAARRRRRRGTARRRSTDLAKSYRARGGSGLGRRYLRAVDGVSFEIRPGESRRPRGRVRVREVDGRHGCSSA